MISLDLRHSSEQRLRLACRGARCAADAPRIDWSAKIASMVLVGVLGTFEAACLQSSGVVCLALLGGIAIGSTALSPRGIRGTIADRFCTPLLPVGYRLRDERRDT